MTYISSNIYYSPNYMGQLFDSVLGSTLNIFFQGIGTYKKKNWADSQKTARLTGGCL